MHPALTLENKLEVNIYIYIHTMGALIAIRVYIYRPDHFRIQLSAGWVIIMDYANRSYIHRLPPNKDSSNPILVKMSASATTKDCPLEVDSPNGPLPDRLDRWI